MYETVSVETSIGDSLINVTDQVRAIVKASGVRSGICFCDRSVRFLDFSPLKGKRRAMKRDPKRDPLRF